jgi:hypothetical protein
MFRGVRRQRKTAKEACNSQRDDADAERQTHPSQNIGHLPLGALLRFGRGKRIAGSSSNLGTGARPDPIRDLSQIVSESEKS